MDSLIEISNIKIGTRFRKDMGDLRSLADSIEDIGLLQPVGLTRDFELIWGHRRLEAFKLLSRESIPCRIIDIDDKVYGEYAENEIRKDFTVSERAAISEEKKRRLSKRHGSNQHKRKHEEDCQNFDSPPVIGRSDDEAAKAGGFGNRQTMRQAQYVVNHGSTALIGAMDEEQASISVAADIATLPPNEQDIIVSLGEKAILMAAKEIRQKKAIERQEANNRIRQQALTTPPPDGQYRCIVIDPPWPMQKIERDLHPEQTPELDYPVMTLEDISDIDLPTADQCHLYLWTTQRFIWSAKDLLTHWGFKHLAIQVWHKNGGFQPAGLPQYNCEFVLIGRKGGLEFMTTKNFPLCFDAPRREHSRKPDAFYDLVRRVSPGPRIDMFSREKREGFEQHGVEINVF